MDFDKKFTFQRNVIGSTMPDRTVCKMSWCRVMWAEDVPQAPLTEPFHTSATLSCSCLRRCILAGLTHHCFSKSKLIAINGVKLCSRPVISVFCISYKQQQAAQPSEHAGLSGTCHHLSLTLSAAERNAAQKITAHCAETWGETAGNSRVALKGFKGIKN